jgi:hypothetical protein
MSLKRNAMPEQTTADPQKIIAELQRKFEELTAQQAATADILKVIASSPGDVQPVFDAIVRSAATRRVSLRGNASGRPDGQGG